MRHRKVKGRLNRRSAWRKATLKSLAKDLFIYQRIETTQAKAKALKMYAEPLITLAKNNPDSVNAMRQVFQKLCDKTVVKILFNDVAPLYKDTPGGYTRTMALGNRKGDGARVVIIELTKRTISDNDLLGIKEEKKAAKPKKASSKAGKKDVETEEKGKEGHAAPEVDIEEKEKRAVEDSRKEQAKSKQKKVADKGMFKRFRRKSIG